MNRMLIDQEGMRSTATELRAIESELDVLRGRLRGAALGAMPPHVVARIGATTARTSVMLHGNGERLQWHARTLEWRATAVEVGSAALTFGDSPYADFLRKGKAIWDLTAALRTMDAAARFLDGWHKNVSPWGTTARGTFGSLAKQSLILDRVPAFGDGPAARAIRNALAGSRHPMASGALRWVTSPAGRKVLQKTNASASGVSFAMDAYTLWKHGDPRETWANDRDAYVSDVASTAFSGSTTLFLVAPSPPTAIAAGVTGVVWVGAEAWEHREQIGETVDDVALALDGGIDVVADHARDKSAEFVRKARFWQ